jgi:hypothetical protein
MHIYFDLKSYHEAETLPISLGKFYAQGVLVRMAAFKVTGFTDVTNLSAYGSATLTAGGIAFSTTGTVYSALRSREGVRSWSWLMTNRARFQHPQSPTTDRAESASNT